MHHEAYVDSLYGIVDAIEHGLYSCCIGSVEQTQLLHDGNLYVNSITFTLLTYLDFDAASYGLFFT